MKRIIIMAMAIVFPDIQICFYDKDVFDSYDFEEGKNRAVEV